MKTRRIGSGIGQAFVRVGGPLCWRRRFRWLAAIVAAPALLMAAPWAAAGPAPASAEEPGLTVEMTCAPESFRPNEWVAVECNQRLTNNNDSTLRDVSLSIGGYNGPIPDYFFVWSERDGELQPVGTGALTFEGRDLEPGHTSVSTLVVLLRMSGGTFESELRVSVGGDVVLTRPFQFVAEAGAAAPPADLLVSHRLAGERVDGDGVSRAVYRTVVTNQGSSTITELEVANRYSDGAALVEADPAPASEKAAFGLAYWDLAAFGEESLAPGEWVEMRTTYGSAADTDCSYTTSGVVVEATMDGQERRYEARAEEGATVGDCRYEEEEYGSGGGVPTGFGRGGEGPAAAEGDVLWAVFVLAGGGVALVGAARALRRRARLGPRIY